MGKVKFHWDEKGGLVISQCDAIKTDPKQCDDCKYRFVCFTERTKGNKTILSSMQIPDLAGLLKQIEITFDEDASKQEH